MKKILAHKKIIAIIVTICLIGLAVFILSTCEKDDEIDLPTKIEQKVSAYRTDLEDSASTMTTPERVNQYLCNWADSKGIKYTIDDYNNVIMEIKASDAYKDAPPTVILCSYDPANFDNYITPMAMALYLAKNNEDTGKLTVIFTNNSEQGFSGIKGLDKKYFPDNANVFNLHGGSKNMWSTVTASSATYTFTDKLEYAKPKGDTAYRISVTGLPGGIPNENINDYPNPIKEMGDLLAYFKTNSLIFELAEIDGGTSAKLYPASASAVIIIDKEDFEQFETRMTTAIETFHDNYDSYDAVYSYEEVKLPTKVLTNRSMNKLIGFLYTLVCGVSERDEDDNVIAVANIGAIECNQSACKIFATGNAFTDKSLNRIDLSYTTTGGLSDIKCTKDDVVNGWAISESEGKPFLEDVSAAFKEYSGDTMKYRDNISVTDCSYIYEKNPDCNLMSITVNENRIEKYTGTLLTFMMNQNITK